MLIALQRAFDEFHQRLLLCGQAKATAGRRTAGKDVCRL
jgi:hypothetical protein